MNHIRNELYRRIGELEPNICEVTVIKHGAVVYEEFWNGFQNGDAVNVMSVTKSIMAILTGIAIDKGFIMSTEDRILKYFPDYLIKRGEKTIQEITIRHLLTMSAPYKYKSEPWTKVCSSDDWTKAALDLIGGRAGITGEFKYSTLGIQIISGILENATGVKLLDFANQYFFSPLGIPNRVGHRAGSKEDYMEFVMSKLPRKQQWYCDPKDTVTAGFGLELSATDMAKIGLLCLDGGVHQGKRVVSEDWIKTMTSPLRTLNERFGCMSYGFWWWITDKGKHIYAAIGDGGNVVYVNPEKDIVVAVGATFKPRVLNRVDFIEKEILPHFI